MFNEVQEYFRAKEAARLLRIGQSTFWRWVSQGRLPQGIRLSNRATVWKLSDLQEFVEQAATGARP